MFGDLTTVSFSFKNGKNDVFQNIKIDGIKQNDPNFNDGLGQAEMESQGLQRFGCRRSSPRTWSSPASTK